MLITALLLGKAFIGGRQHFQECEMGNFIMVPDCALLGGNIVVHIANNKRVI
jgi:hypothetical protein